jgi:hypothetical protein
MQNFKRNRKKSRLVFEVQPQQTVPFQGKTTGTQYTLPYLVVSVRQELRKPSAANGTFDFITKKEDGRYFHHGTADPDQQGTWNGIEQ